MIELSLLDAGDAGWITTLVDEAQAASGRRWHELVARLEGLAAPTTGARQAAATTALRRLIGRRNGRGFTAAKVRQHALGAPVLTADARQARIAAVAKLLEMTSTEVEDGMWSDLPGERVVSMAQRPLELAVAAAANVHVLQTALRRALLVRIEVPGDPRPLARAAARQGLLATVRATAGGAVTEISGPLALFHRTTVYGRALGALVPALASCASFAMTIRGNLGRGIGDAVVASPVLLPAYKPPPRYAAELRLERDLRKLLPDAVIDATPGALTSGDGDVVFPDLAIRRGERARYVEVVGFWSADHVLHRLAQYNAAGCDDVVLCVDSARAVADGDLTVDPRVVRFQGRIEAAAVLAAIG